MDRKKYKGFTLNGRDTTAYHQDGKQYTVSVYHNNYKNNFKFIAKASKDAIITSVQNDGFDGDEEQALGKMKEIAFTKAKEKIDNKDYDNEEYLYQTK